MGSNHFCSAILRLVDWNCVECVALLLQFFTTALVQSVCLEWLLGLVAKVFALEPTEKEVVVSSIPFNPTLCRRQCVSSQVESLEYHPRKIIDHVLLNAAPHILPGRILVSMLFSAP